MADEDATARDFARDRIAALMDEDSDSDTGAEWNPKLTAIPSSSQEEQIKTTSTTNYDLNLDDEDTLPAQASSHFEDANIPTQEDDDDGSAAYARMMKSMLTKKKPVAEEVAASEAKNVSSPAKSIPAVAEVESSEEDMPVKKTIRRPRVASSPSPARSSSSQLPQVARSPSPSLFVSPARSQRVSPSPRKQAAAGSDSDSDDMPMTIPKAALLSLVAKKRAEREAKEREEKEKKQTARKQEAEKQKKLAKQYKQMYSSEMDDGMTEEARDALVENSRPTQRKASKKALEEMNRETQRMARNQQLTHQARVKRKYGTADFLKDIGFAGSSPKSDHAQNRGALVSSDNETHVQKGTPPSSPPSIRGSQEKTAGAATVDEDEYIIRTGPKAEASNEELPDIKTIFSDPVRAAAKGKGKAVPASPVQKQPVKTTARPPRKQIRISAPPKMDDSDDDLEIVPKKPSRFAVFDNLPEGKAHESKSLLSLRAFAQMSPPSKNKRNGRHTMTHAELQRQLALQMHKQTVAEKQERIAELRAKGIEFKTEEEIEEDQLYIENMLEKARQEAMALGRKENEAAKKNGEDIDENYALPSEDEDEDADFEDEEDEEADVEMSGSEEEDGGEGDDGAERTGMFDDAAEEAGDDEEESEEEHEDEVMADALPEAVVDADDEEAVLPQNARNKPRNRNVVLDDDDEEDLPAQAPTPSVAAKTSTHTSPVNAAFGFAMPAADLGLTQMFKGTMEDLATQEDDTQATPARQSLDFLRDAPVPTLPAMSPAMAPAGLLVPSSQANMATPSKPQYAMSATPGFTPQFPTPARVGSQMSPTKMSEIPEPTQDAGFESFPGTRTGQPHSTVETVMMSMPESPVVQKKGKLRRRAQQIAELSDDEATASVEIAGADGEEEFELTTNAFDALFKGAKKPPQAETFDKKLSEAKKMFEEQAEESEDEYAGLGGASDDESDNGVDEEVQKMIDEGPVDVKEGELAKFYADRDRADDEKRIDRLYKDITTGALRRKRGVGVDELSDDSDDEAAERRRRKQAEFRKMRQALLLDENVGKIGECLTSGFEHGHANKCSSRQSEEICFPESD